MQVETSFVTSLEKCIQSLVESQSPSDIFKILLKGSRLAAPLGSIFLVRQGTIKGWGSIGYDETVAKAQRAFRTGSEHGWLGELVQDPSAELRVRASGGDPDFGQAAANDSAAITVRVKGRAIAVLMAERSTGESPWLPDTLSLLVAVAQMRLELDLALRKLKTERSVETPPAVAELATPPAVAEVVAEPVAPAVELVTAETVAPEAEPTFQIDTSGLQTEDETTEVAEVHEAEEDDPEIAAARRFARLVATDIRLYNEEAVMNGRREKDLVARLGDQLGRGRETFLKRHGSMGSAALEILHDALVEVLAAGDKELLPVSALD